MQLAADLFAVLETPAGNPPPRVKSLQAFALRHTNADELHGVVTQLDLGVRIVALAGAKLLIAAGPEDTLKELAELVQALDVPAVKPPKPKEQKKLFPEEAPPPPPMIP